MSETRKLFLQALVFWSDRKAVYTFAPAASKVGVLGLGGEIVCDRGGGGRASQRIALLRAGRTFNSEDFSVVQIRFSFTRDLHDKTKF